MQQPQTSQSPRSASLALRELIEGEHLPSYSEACVQQHHSVLPQQSGSNSDVLQIVNPQSIVHPDARERSVLTANSPDVLTVRLPPLLSGEEPPPSYPRGEPPPPYPKEEPLSPYAVTTLV